MLVLLPSKSSGTWKDKGPSLLNSHQKMLAESHREVEEIWKHWKGERNSQLCLFPIFWKQGFSPYRWRWWKWDVQSKPKVVTDSCLQHPFLFALHWTLRCTGQERQQSPSRKDGRRKEEKCESVHLRLLAHYRNILSAELHTPGDHVHLGSEQFHQAVTRANPKTPQVPQKTV